MVVPSLDTEHPGIRVIAEVASVLQAGLASGEALHGVVGALRRGLNLRRCRLWLRTPDGTRYTPVTTPGDEAELPGYEPPVAEWVRRGVQRESVPGGAVMRLPLVHEDELLGALEVIIPTGRHEGIAHDVVVVVARLLAPLIATTELSQDLASEVALRRDGEAGGGGTAGGRRDARDQQSAGDDPRVLRGAGPAERDARDGGASRLRRVSQDHRRGGPTLPPYRREPARLLATQERGEEAPRRERRGGAHALSSQAPRPLQAGRRGARAHAGTPAGARGPGAADPELHGADAQRDGRDGLARDPHGAERREPRPRGRGAARVHRYREGHQGRGSAQDLRAVFHHQAPGPGDGPGPVDLLRHHRGAPRPDRRRVAGGRRLELQGVSSGGMKILVIEDDKTVGQYVKRGLAEAGYHADLVGDGAEGLRLSTGGSYDLLVLDLRLPKLSGLELLRMLRDRDNGIPVLVLTAQDAVDFKVQALKMGADDYVTKPFSLEELLARVEALGRRPKAIAPPVLKVADLTLDSGSREVRRGGKVIELTPKEYAVLEYLMRYQGRVMPRTLITEYAWDYHFDPGTNIVDVVITRLRKKIDHGREPKLIHTVRGVGYTVKA